MKLLHSRVPYNFGGLEFSEFGKSKAVVLPVPYDATSSYGGGARNGPQAIISASRNMELFDLELGREPAEVGIFTLDELEPSTASPEKNAKRVEDAVSKIAEAKKFPLLLGGEHSISIGAIRALKKKHGKFTILQFDAHPDLRDEYEDSKYNHACVMRRALEEGCNLVQVGIRSVCKDDYSFMQKNKKTIMTFFAKDMDEWDVSQIVSSCSENVYISFDLDALDTSIMPSTGTPEPDGMFFAEAVEIISEVCKQKKIIGADVVELAPIPGLIAPDFLSARLAYKIIGNAVK